MPILHMTDLDLAANVCRFAKTSTLVHDGVVTSDARIRGLPTILAAKPPARR